MRSLVWDSLGISITIVFAVSVTISSKAPHTNYFSLSFHGVRFSIEIKTRLSHNRAEVWLFTPLHRIWAFVYWESLLRALRSNLCCRCGYRVCGKSDQWISGGQEGLLRELTLGLLVGVNRWMDRLLEEWAAQRTAALFIKWCRKYIIKWLINFTSIIFSL